MTQALIRPATAADLATLVDIYNHYVRTSHVTFDIEPFEVEARREWFEGFDREGPHRCLVAERGGSAVAYACSTPFRPKPAYGRSVETTVYVNPETKGEGLGSQVYRALIDTLEGEPEVHRAYAGIALPNDPSVALHVELEFQLVGTYRQVGYKFGRYWDVSRYERDLDRPTS